MEASDRRGTGTNRIWAEVREIAILGAVGFAMTWLVCRSCSNSVSLYLTVSSFSAMMWIALWKGNALLSDVVSRWVSWLEFPLRRFVIGVITMVLYTLLALFVLLKVYEYQFDLRLDGGFMMYFSASIVTVIISLFMHGKSFLEHWKESSIQAERLQKENMKSKYESLKSQVNPHFLFNSLNALTNLVYEDRDQAAKFIKQLSQVYRYVLDTRDRELVPKEEELEFLKSYLFLQQIRFEKNLKVSINLENTDTHFPPLVLQMLIENAIKHNVISGDTPLEIRISGDNGFVVVENSLRRKKVMDEDSPGIGLENIRMRYEFLSTRKVQVEQTDQLFTVRLPVIELSDI